jgi:hypothetical protein
MTYQEHFHLSYDEAASTPIDVIHRFFDMKKTEKEFNDWKNQDTPQQ